MNELKMGVFEISIDVSTQMVLESLGVETVVRVLQGLGYKVTTPQEEAAKVTPSK